MSHRLSRAACFVTLLTLSACRDAESPTGLRAIRPRPTPMNARVKDSVPDGTGIGTIATANALPRTRYRVDYHGGYIKIGTSNVYLIWYGNWNGSPAAQQVLPELVATLGGSSYWRASTLYPDGGGIRPSGGVVFSGEAFDVAYSHGAVLAAKDADDLMAQTILGGQLPLDQNGIYLILASADVSTPGYATSFCAFHRAVDVVGARVAYAFIIDPTRAPTACAPQMLGPNGTLGADAMASLMTAELFDIVTDGYNLGGYYDRLGLEPASKCAWTYGTTYTAPNGAKANVKLGGRDYLLQQLWLPSKSSGACGMHL